MRRILNIAFYLLLVLCGLVFAILNSDLVTLSYYIGSREVPLSLIMFSALILGVVIGVLVSLGQVMKARHEISKLKKSVQLAEKEVTNLRTIPIKDNH